MGLTFSPVRPSARIDTVLTMHAMRPFALILIATFALIAAGCGGSSTTAGGIGTGPSPAAELKPGALVYWETATDPGSDQWQQAEDLLRRFPDGGKWIEKLREEIADEGLNWEQDVKPVLGETTAVAAYPGSGAETGLVVGLTNPDDPDKLVALVKKHNTQTLAPDPTVTRVVGDWVVVAESEAAIDAALKTSSGGSLADEQSFTSAMAGLPDDTLSRLYADPAAALEAFGSADAEVARAFTRLGLDGLDYAAAWVKATDDGAELAFTAGGEGAARLLGAGQPYSSALLERVPTDALAFMSFQGPGATRQLEERKTNPLYAMGLRQFERELGVKLEDLVSLADGEVAFFARMALPIPELTLMLESDNPEQARASAEKLLRAFAEREGGQVTEDGEVTTAIIDGFPVNLGSVGDVVVFSTSKDAFEELAATADKLPDSDRWRSALEAADAPDEYTSLAYADLGDAVALLQVYLGVSGRSEHLPPEVARNLEALKTLVAWGTLDGDVASARAFVEID
jgi:hypothetical protein